MTKKIALVTGANRGIGLEIAKQLAEQDIHVIVGSRDLAKGQQAAAEILEQTGKEVEALALDVSRPDSIVEAMTKIVEHHGALHILVNNAGVFLDNQAQQNSVFEVTPETLEASFATNLYGPLRLIQEALPLMRRVDYGRIVNLSSGMGQLSDMGGGSTGYRLSKVALNALTRIVAAELKNEKIKINTMCPGWVRTDMGGPNASRSVEQGADTAVWLATLAADGPSGGFFRDRQAIPW